MTIAVQTTQRHTQRQLLPPLDAWAGKRSSYPREQTVAQLFEEIAVRYPERTALAFGEQALSYGELNRRSNVLARSLVRSGAGRETLVGLCAERSLEMIVGMLA
ncbi:MAG TPA: AMP-binding protein, partial [Dongiaceae bacterium]|nr:AMP-binding protein [Dongiaceae bacterium]